MLKGKWLYSAFILAFAFAISIAYSVTPHNHSSHHSSKLPSFVHSLDYDFINLEQVNFSSKVNSDEEIEEVDESDESLLTVPCTFLVVPAADQLSLPTRKTCGPTSSQLLVVTPLRAPPVFLV